MDIKFGKGEGGSFMDSVHYRILFGWHPAGCDISIIYIISWSRRREQFIKQYGTTC